MGFPRQEYWSGLPFPSPEHLPDPGIKPVSLALAERFFTTEPRSLVLFVRSSGWLVPASALALAASPCACVLQRQLLFFNLMNHPLLASHFSSATSSPLSAFIEPCSGLSFGLKGMLWLACSSIQTTKTFSISAVRLFHFHISCVHWSSSFNFLKSFPFALTTWLTVWCKRRSLWSVLAFNTPPH